MALNAQEIINYIADSPKKTPVKIYVNLSAPVDFGPAEVFGEGKSRIVFGDWAELAPSWRTTGRRSPTAWWRTTAGTPACPCWT